ncbi:MAG: FAD:protein FMN transferase [Spirochaetota bacterium]
MKRIIILLLMAAAVLAGCSKKEVYTKSEMMIGTVINLTAAADEKQTAQQAFDAAFAEVERIGALMGPYGDSSAVRKINEAGADDPVEIDGETFDLISRSIEFSKLSEGGFDITFTSAGSLWDFSKSPFVIPSEEEVAEAIAHVGYQHLILDEDAKTVTKDDSKVRIGLGGIAKGYIIDRGVEVMKQHGIEAGIVDAGGDLRVFGKKNGKPWRAGVRHPRKKDAVIMTVELADGEACATSGDYERMIVTKDDKRYHHIIDPRTGYPTETFSSVTVITDNAVDADAFATAFFVMGVSRSIQYASEHDDVSVILIDRYMNTYASKSLKKKINVEDDTFTVEWLEKY